MMNNNDKHDETIHSHTKDVPTFLLPSFSNLPKSMSNYKKSQPKRKELQKQTVMWYFIYLCVYFITETSTTAMKYKQI